VLTIPVSSSRAASMSDRLSRSMPEIVPPTRRRLPPVLSQVIF
jgi:hypothetical protein